MGFLIHYQCPPEDAIIHLLKNLIKESKLIERNVDAPIVPGHPLFAEGISDSVDTQFPKYGVEWVRDHRTDSIGMNADKIRPTDELKTRLQEYKKFLSDTYRVSADKEIDELCRSNEWHIWKHTVESEVVISGFASGGTGRRTAKWMYETVDGVIAPLIEDLGTVYNVSCKTSDVHEVNIQMDSFATPVWGFEIPLKICQVRTTFRTPPKTSPDKLFFDIFIKDSKTDLGLTTYGSGYYNNPAKIYEEK